jgi:hypothetical protein
MSKLNAFPRLSAEAYRARREKIAITFLGTAARGKSLYNIAFHAFIRTRSQVRPHLREIGFMCGAVRRYVRSEPSASGRWIGWGRLRLGRAMRDDQINPDTNV